MRVPPARMARQNLIAFLNKDLGTTEVAVRRRIWKSAKAGFDLIMSQPEYQLS